MALFGSMSRGEAREGRDIDILVSFDGPAISARYFGVLFYLEGLLGHPVDLVTDKALCFELRPYVEREALRVSRPAVGTLPHRWHSPSWASGGRRSGR